MLSKSDRDKKPVIDLFTSLGVEFALLVPTATAIDKSIIDATLSVRNFLEISELHSYQNQAQGPEHKTSLPIKICSEQKEHNNKASLYRPNTKSGDPRIWFYGLKKFVSANNLLAVTKYNNGLLVINCSSPRIWHDLNNPESRIRSLINETKGHLDIIKLELLANLRKIADKGFVKALGHGPTSIGMTLEKLLGVPTNSSPKPDYKGIELKSGNASKSGNTTKLKTIISMAPDWKSSNVKDAKDLLNKYSYLSEGRRNLAFTMHSQVPNTKDWKLSVDLDKDILWAGKPLTGEPEILYWDMQKLMKRLKVKHKMTAWVSAKKKIIDGETYFKYEKVTFTQDPPISQIPYRLDDGTMKVDLTMHLKENGKARDHGYLFRVQEKDHHLLFPKPELFLLT
ncbi:MAG: MvaI/BcnI family restriction endonuclease [Emcibacteraceae bacterium]|nr:MvaI/BcnI family restriction endonuclease [Emcibacteraceae bacterium]